ncbi:MAG: hypothetical protein EA381_00510 [Planctomycetaceae bacterium]|nr:MAG: hypothetical protein EA381_00510 [Planctomycetaceae bacterium]
MDETAWLWLDRITIVSAFLAAVFSIATWLGTQWLRKAKRQAEARRRAPITIRLKAGDRLLDLPYQPRRDQLSRSELSGLLSFYHGPDRFDPVIMRRVLESGDLNRVLADDRPESGAHEVLVVKVDDEFLSAVRSEISERDRSAAPIPQGSPPEATPSEQVALGRPPRVWNLTPHEVHYDDGRERRSIKSDGSLRLGQVDQPESPIDGLATVTTRYEEPEQVPEGIEPGDVLIVSTLVGDKWDKSRRPPGITLLVPDTGATSRRDDAGRIVSVTRFIRK